MSVNTKVNGQLVPSAGLYSVTKPIGMADIYSTEEKEVGLWVDNKPLYQKTFLITPTSASFTVDISSLNIEKLIDRQATLSRAVSSPSGIQQKDVQYRTETSGYNSYGVVCELINDTIQVGIEGYTVSEITEIRVTLKYTKTTDTPWSGKFVPQGYGYVSSGDIYSLEERQIGVWTDGKPLYQKTFVTEKTNIAGNSSINVNSELSPLNVDEVISYKDKLTYTISGGTGQYYSDDIARLRKASSDYDIVLSVGSATLATLKIEWTIQYTKTTDVAGSGEYVPSGDKAVHYSTDEEVIGTWLGATLYRRVFDLGANISIANNAFATTTIDASSMETLVDAKAIYSTGVTVYNIMANINNNIIRLQADRNDNQISARYIILEYTKTS